MDNHDKSTMINKAGSYFNIILACLLTGPQLSCIGQLSDSEQIFQADLDYAPLIGDHNSAPSSSVDGKKSPSRQTATAPLRVTIKEAMLLTLENNKEIKAKRLSADILLAREVEEQAVFAPVLTADYTLGREVTETTGQSQSITKTRNGQIGLTTTMATGTEIELGLSSTDSESSVVDEQNKVRGSLSITQALSRGYGLDVNLAEVRRAKLATIASSYELRGAAEALVAEVEKTCWQLLLTQQRMAIFNDSLKLAENQLLETRERIKIGKIAAVELYAAQAEVALRRGYLIDARSNLANVNLKLKGLLNLTGDGQWDREIIVVDSIILPMVRLDKVATHVQVALKWRPELNQTRLEMRRGDLEIVKTKNGLLPLLDFFLSLAKSGYGASFSDSLDDLEGDSYDILGGIKFELPVANRAAKARHERAELTRQLMEIALENMVKIVEIDVRSAFIEVNRTREQIEATAATRKLQEETVKGETEKFRVGKSTALLVAQSQRDLMVSKIAEVEAVVKYRTALIELYRLEGSLLERRGVKAPGRDLPTPSLGG